MTLHDTAAEVAFFDPIDAAFPYNDAERASALIAEGWSISLNAAFFVLHEICWSGPTAGVSRRRLIGLLEEWRSGPGHPLKEPLIKCAMAIIEDALLPLEDGLIIMDEIAAYEAQRNALAIASFASYREAPGLDEALEEAYQRIVGEWEQKGV
jgi:hypothetical protein